VEKVSGLLKAFVIGAGVVLLGGTLLLAVLIVMRATGGGPGDRERVVRPLELELDLPAGARIEQVVPDGSRIILLGVDGENRQFLALIDPGTGERLGLIHLRPGE